MTRPHHLFDVWPALRPKLANPRHVALFTDFDGTLVRIQRRPGGVRLAPPAQRLLARLARTGAVLGVISGRRLEDVRSRAGLRGIWYAGVHGFFLRDPAGRTFTLMNSAEQARMRRVRLRLSRLLRGVSGIAVEPKGATVAVHYRNAPPRSAASAWEALARCRREIPGLHLMEGKKVWELHPEREVDKWAAIQFILKRERAKRSSAGRTLIYLGDDTTDERVFRKMKGISVAVGKRHKTAARFFLHSPTEVRQFLERVSAIWP